MVRSYISLTIASHPQVDTLNCKLLIVFFSFVLSLHDRKMAWIHMYTTFSTHFLLQKGIVATEV